MKGQKVLNPRGMALLVGMLPLYHEDVEAGAQKLCYLWLGKAVKRKIRVLKAAKKANFERWFFGSFF